MHILGELKPSGAEVMYHAAADLWRREGLDCEILSIGQTPGIFAPILEGDGYRIHHMPFASSAGIPGSARHLLRLYEFLRRSDYNVIHINSEYACFWYALMARLAGKSRLFRTIHGKFAFRGFLRFERRIHRWIMRSLLGVTMISVSGSVRDMEICYFGNPTVLIPNWFDSKKYHRATEEQRFACRMRLDIPAEAMVICSVGNCQAVKNHGAILEAIARRPLSSPLVYLHAGEEQSENSERQEAERLGILAQVRFLGPVSDVLPVLHASDVFLMPSLTEGMSCAALEAMGAGVPVVLSRLAGFSDFDVCSDICWIEPSPEGVAEAISNFWHMPVLERRAVGRRLSARVHENFGLQNGALAYARLYKG